MSRRFNRTRDTSHFTPLSPDVLHVVESLFQSHPRYKPLHTAIMYSYLDTIIKGFNRTRDTSHFTPTADRAIGDDVGMFQSHPRYKPLHTITIKNAYRIRK